MPEEAPHMSRFRTRALATALIALAALILIAAHGRMSK